MITFSRFHFPQEAIESGQTPPKSGGFSFKGLSSMIFGAETPEVLETKIDNLGEQIHDAEETVTKNKEELRSKSFLIIKIFNK